MKNILVLLFLLGCCSLSTIAQPATANPDWKNTQVLIYTCNGKGYVHDNIPFAIAGLKKLVTEKGFQADASDDPTLFTVENLKKYSILIFASTNNDVFDTDEQRVAFRRYIEGGGGFVGVHSVVGTERNWTWFKTMLGGTFAWHPPFQRYKLKVVDAAHPSVAGLPLVWEREDECYFLKEMYPGIKPVLAHDLTSLQVNEKDSIRIASSSGPYSILYPAAWYHSFDGGSVWITALGHDKKDYSDPVFIQHLWKGIEYIARLSRKPDFSKAYALSKDDPVK
jgi:type 1 glutamine amidotransferase